MLRPASCPTSSADKFTQIDRYVCWKLFRLMVKKRGRNLHADVAHRWTDDWFHQQRLYHLRGTIRHPKAA